MNVPIIILVLQDVSQSFDYVFHINLKVIPEGWNSSRMISYVILFFQK